MDYFVTPSIATEDAAVWQDRENGSLDLVVKLSRDDDGAPDARHPVTLTIDLHVTDDHHVIVRQNGTELLPTEASAADVLRKVRDVLTPFAGGLKAPIDRQASALAIIRTSGVIL